LIEYLLSIEKEKYGAIFILYSYIGLILWNTFCTRWLYFATPPGGIVAIVLNALLMCIPLYLFYCTKKAHGNKIGYISLPIYWLSFEYLHLNWELSWTWLNIGNGLCDMTNLIQWYVYTGVLGGTLWVWVINISLFLVVKYLLEKNRTKSSKWLKLAMIFIFIPFGISILIEQKNKIKTETMEVIVVQPNIDPYHEKYGSMSYRNQLARMIRLSDSLITDQTRLVVWPETAVLYIDMDRLEKESLIKMMRGFIDKHPKITIISGIVGNRFYNNRKTITAQTFSNGACCYDEYNAAIRLDSSSVIETYNKSKLVPLVENIPYGEVFHGLSIDLGGTVGSLAKDEQRKAFGVGSNKVAPIICYESIYGSFVGDFVQEGAELLLILTNDAWWYYPEKKGGNMIGSRLGYQQHFSYAKMRAIESGKAIARAANTGLSGFIDINGNVIKQTKYWEKDALIAKLPISKESSFYHKHGDYMGRICGILSIFIILVMIVSKKTEHYKFRKT
jgi:apolipoprotein N-acyltransferase